jgi:large subunit ribosomal protein L23
MPTVHETIVRPLVTEKTSAAYQRSRERDPAQLEYTFEVHPKASKPQIRSAIEELFGVKVKRVWTSSQRGKVKRMGKTAGRRPNWKKAIVQLAPGDSIPVFEG